MISCPNCGSSVHADHWKTISTERNGTYTVFSYVTTRCAKNCGYAETTSSKQEKFEMS